VQLLFEVIMSNDERVKIKLRKDDNVIKIAQEMTLKYQLDDVRANRLRCALREAKQCSSISSKETISFREVDELERHWDIKRGKWFAYNRVTGMSQWI
jgi:hypothetical protein